MGKYEQISNLKDKEKELLKNITTGEHPDLGEFFEKLHITSIGVHQANKLLAGEMPDSSRKRIETTKKKISKQQEMLEKEINTLSNYFGKILKRYKDIQALNLTLADIGGNTELLMEIRVQKLEMIGQLVREHIDVLDERDIDLEIAIPEISSIFNDILDYV